MLSEFVPLPSRLASSPLYQSLSALDDDVVMPTHGRGRQPTAAASDNVVAVQRRSTTYYNNWKSSHSDAAAAAAAAAAGEMSLMDVEGGECLSAADGDSGSELSSNSYEHLDAGRARVDEMGDGDECFVGALNDSASLVSVTVERLSVTGISDS